MNQNQNESCKLKPNQNKKICNETHSYP